MEVAPEPRAGRRRASSTSSAAFRPVAEQKELAFDVEVADDAPPTLVTDEQRLQQVLRNLLSNAFKFTEEGASRCASARDRRGRLRRRRRTRCRVHGLDTGIGIAEDKLRADLRVLPAGRRDDEPALRRHRASGCRSAARSRGCSAARSACAATRARAARSRCCCRRPTRRRRRRPSPSAPSRAGAAAELPAPGRRRRARRRRHAATAPRRAAPRPRREAPDDRGRIAPGDRVVLSSATGRGDASTLSSGPRGAGCKGIVRDRRRRRPRARPRARARRDRARGADRRRRALLDQLKHHPRDAPHPGLRRRRRRRAPATALRAGRRRLPGAPASARGARRDARRASTELLDRTVKRVLVVEDDEVERERDRRADRRRRRRRHRGRRRARRRWPRSTSDALRLHRARPQAAEGDGLRAARAHQGGRGATATCR